VVRGYGSVFAVAGKQTKRRVKKGRGREKSLANGHEEEEEKERQSGNWKGKAVNRL